MEKTLSELAADFTAWLAARGRSPLTVQNYSYDLDKMVRWLEANKLHPRDTRTADIERWMQETQQELSLKAVSINRALATARSWWKWMRREGYCQNSAPGDCERLKKPARLPVYLSNEEQAKLRAALAADGPGIAWTRDRALIGTALWTGMRASEISALRLTELDLAAGVIRILSAKGQKSREVPVPSQLHELLTEYLATTRLRLLRGKPEASPYVFVSAHASKKKSSTCGSNPHGEPLTTRAIWWAVTRCTEQVLGKRYYSHSLRHSYASTLRAAGCDLMMLSEVLGHSDLTTTAMYAHLSNKQRNSEVSRMLAM